MKKQYADKNDTRKEELHLCNIVFHWCVVNNEYTTTRRTPGKKSPKTEIQLLLMEKQSIADEARWGFICNLLSFVCDSASTLIFSRVEASVNIVLIFHRRPRFEKHNNVKVRRASSRRRPGGGNAVTNVCHVIFLPFGEQSRTAAAAALKPH